MQEKTLTIIIMATLNQISIIGYVGADPDVKTWQDGNNTTNLKVAVTERWSGRTGNIEEHTEWFPCVFNGKLADIAGQYIRKGSMVYVQGRIRTRKFKAQDGSDRYVTEVIAMTLQLLDRKDNQTTADPSSEQMPKKVQNPQSTEDDMPAWLL